MTKGILNNYEKRIFKTTACQHAFKSTLAINCGILKFPLGQAFIQHFPSQHQKMTSLLVSGHYVLTILN